MTPSPKPTPGPWHAGEYDPPGERWFVYGESPEDIPIADMIHSKADARFIASAPDLAAKLAEAEKDRDAARREVRFLLLHTETCYELRRSPGFCDGVEHARHFLASLRGDPTSSSTPSRSSLRVKFFSAPPRKDPCAVPDCEWNWDLIWAGRPHEGLSHEYRPIPRSEDTPHREASA